MFELRTFQIEAKSTISPLQAIYYKQRDMEYIIE